MIHQHLVLPPVMCPCVITRPRHRESADTYDLPIEEIEVVVVLISRGLVPHDPLELTVVFEVQAVRMI